MVMRCTQPIFYIVVTYLTGIKCSHCAGMVHPNELLDPTTSDKDQCDNTICHSIQWG